LGELLAYGAAQIAWSQSRGCHTLQWRGKFGQGGQDSGFKPVGQKRKELTDSRSPAAQGI